MPSLLAHLAVPHRSPVTYTAHGNSFVFGGAASHSLAVRPLWVGVEYAAISDRL